MTIIPYAKKYKSDVILLINLNTPEYFASHEEQDLNNYLEAEIEDYFVVEINNKIVGAGGINYKRELHQGIISWDIIHPDFQGKGVGKYLLEYRLNIIKSDKTINRVIVRTSQLVYKFYEKAGFQLIEIKKDFWSKGLDMYYMEIESKKVKPKQN